MTRYRGWSGWRGGAGRGGGWEAGGRSNPQLGLFELAMSPRSASHMPKHYGVGKSFSRKADQLTKPGNGIVYV